MDANHIDHISETVTSLRQVYDSVFYRIIAFFEKEKILEDVLPKKPKTIDDIFVNMQLTLKYAQEKNISLKQESILGLDKKTVLDCEIFIPRKHYDLVKCGAVMGQCVGDGNYTMEINKGNSKIILLKKDNKFKYCIELDSKNRVRMSGAYKNNKIPDKYLKEVRNLVKELANS